MIRKLPLFCAGVLMLALAHAAAPNLVNYQGRLTDGRVGIGSPSPQGALDVASTTGALIVPRMTTAQRDSFAAVNGMIIYNTTTNQFNFRENGAWVIKYKRNGNQPGQGFAYTEVMNV